MAEISFLHILKTLIDWSLICRNIVLHRDNMVPAFPQGFKYDAAIVFPVFLRRGEIDGHLDKPVSKYSTSEQIQVFQLRDGWMKSRFI